MATGAGVTFTACNFSWRLLCAYRRARRPVPGRPQQPGRPDVERVPELRPARRGITSSTRPTSSSTCTRQPHRPRHEVVITTISVWRTRCCAARARRSTEDPPSETWSGGGRRRRRAAPGGHNPAVPIEHFDVIVTDECHRSIWPVAPGAGVFRRAPPHRPDDHALGAHAGLLQRNLVAGTPTSSRWSTASTSASGLPHPHAGRRTRRHGGRELPRAGARPRTVRYATSSSTPICPTRNGISTAR